MTETVTDEMELLIKTGSSKKENSNVKNTTKTNKKQKQKQETGDKICLRL